MRLFSRGVLFMLPVIVACRNNLEPQSSRISGMYVLQNVDGAALPAMVSAGAGDTTYIVASVVSLNSEGAAVTTNTFRHIYLQYPAEQTTYLLDQAYRIKGDSIEIGAFTPCAGGVTCVGNIHGSFDSSTLTVAEFYSPYPANPILYRYRPSHP